MRDFIKERNSLLKEYGSRLEQLSKRFHGKVESRKSISSGMTSISASLLSDTWILAWGHTLQESINFGRDLISIADQELDRVYSQFKSLEKTEEEIKLQLNEFHQEMLQLFQEEQNKLEFHQSKYNDSYDQLAKLEQHPSDKSEKKSSQSRHDTICRKIEYLLQIICFNKIQEGLFDQQYPFFYACVEEMASSRIERTKSIWKSILHINQDNIAAKQEKYDEKLFQFVDAIDTEADASNITSKFKSILQQHLQNKTSMRFQQSSALDDESFTMTSHSESFLINLFHQKTKDLESIQKECNIKKKECDGLENLKDTYRNNPSLGNYHSVQQSWLGTMKEYTFLIIKKEAIQAQLDEIKSFMKEDDKLSATRHQFKSSSFTISSKCNVCNQFIWGLGKSTGFQCEVCKYVCHAKCQMKANPICSMNDEQGKTEWKDKDDDELTRPLSRNTELPPSDIVVALYDYNAQNEDELDLIKEQCYSIIEMKEDGWIQVKDSNGNIGLVPSNYINTSNQNHVTALYDYNANSPDELTMKKGDAILVIEFGEDDGWLKGKVVSTGQAGLFPSNYVK